MEISNNQINQYTFISKINVLLLEGNSNIYQIDMKLTKLTGVYLLVQ